MNAFLCHDVLKFLRISLHTLPNVAFNIPIVVFVLLELALIELLVLRWMLKVWLLLLSPLHFHELELLGL